MMDIDKISSKIYENLRWQIRNKVLTNRQKDNKEEEKEELEKQIKALKGQVIPLQVTKLVHKTHK